MFCSCLIIGIIVYVYSPTQVSVIPRLADCSAFVMLLICEGFFLSFLANPFADFHISGGNFNQMDINLKHELKHCLMAYSFQ